MATLRNFAASLKVLIEAQLDVVAQNLSDGRGCVIARLDQLVEAMTVMVCRYLSLL